MIYNLEQAMDSPPIIKLLTDEVLESVNEQFQHLEDLAKAEGEEKARHKDMLYGAKLIMNIIENDPIGQHGTVNFLKSLDREQLSYAIEQGQKILKEKTSKGKKLLYGVFSNNNSNKWFEDENAAKVHFMDVAAKELDSRYPEVSFEKRSVPIEELPDYLDS